MWEFLVAIMIRLVIKKKYLSFCTAFGMPKSLKVVQKRKFWRIFLYFVAMTTLPSNPQCPNLGTVLEAVQMGTHVSVLQRLAFFSYHYP